jgi:anti-sigma B factor antagonist
MPSTQPSDPAPSTLRIEGEMTIYRAHELKALLLDALAASTALDVDLSAVTELDTAGLQVLMLAKQSAQADGRSMRLLGHSHAVAEVFELLDLASCFGDAIMIAPTGRT